MTAARFDPDGPSPKMMEWAREQIGLEIKDAAAMLGFRKSTNVTPEERLLEFEHGRTTPSHSMIEKMGKVYRVPITVFYLRTPPRASDVGKDFRVTHGVTATKQQTAALRNLMVRFSARQGCLRNALHESKGPAPLDLVGHATKKDSVQDVVQFIRRLVNVETKNIAWPTSKPPSTLFAALRDAIERAGVFVVSINASDALGEVLDERVFRNYTIAESTAPMIFINSRDATASESLALVHGLTLLLLNETGVSNHPSPSLEPPSGSSDEINQFCNDVAAEFLVPTSCLYGFRATGCPSEPISDIHEAGELVHAVARARSVSMATVAYRLARSGWITEQTHDLIVHQCRESYQNCRNPRRARRATNLPAAPTQPADSPMRSCRDQPSASRKQLGNALVDVVQSLLSEETLTHTKAALILDASPTEVSSL